MAKQIININAPNDLIGVGRNANTGDGDKLRDAFIKINDALDKADANFTELYATGALGAPTVLDGGTASTTF